MHRVAGKSGATVELSLSRTHPMHKRCCYGSNSRAGSSPSAVTRRN